MIIDGGKCQNQFHQNSIFIIREYIIYNIYLLLMYCLHLANDCYLELNAKQFLGTNSFNIIKTWEKTFIGRLVNR